MSQRAAVILALVVLLLVLVRSCQPPVRITVAPTPTRAIAHLMFLPAVGKPRTPLGHGVALVPSPDLYADWYYVYWRCDSPCVPMNKEGYTPQGWCAPAQLLFNEPTNPESAGGYPIPIEEAVRVSRAVRAECPEAYLVAVNFVQYEAGIQWAHDFIALGGAFDAVGFHAYCYNAQACIDHAERVKREFDVPLCFTEYNTTSPDPGEFQALLAYVMANFDCSAVFTSYWKDEPILNLQEADGTLNAKGEIFAARP